LHDPCFHHHRLQFVLSTHIAVRSWQTS
jgi:hypothetical protein